ncbi:hypothetical protein ON010_g553 [Phytophthora cinnamomi]|nr:hypothetical protein ON010_g553 [Phytophthora cinnamomi]
MTDVELPGDVGIAAVKDERLVLQGRRSLLQTTQLGDRVGETGHGDGSAVWILATGHFKVHARTRINSVPCIQPQHLRELGRRGAQLRVALQTLAADRADPARTVLREGRREAAVQHPAQDLERLGLLALRRDDVGERRPTSVQLGQHHAERVDVRLLRVAPALQHFGRDPVRRPHPGRHGAALAGATDAKVDDPRLQRLRQQDVHGLEVPVDDGRLSAVDVAERVGDADGHAELVTRPGQQPAALLEEPPQVSHGAVLHHHGQAVDAAPGHPDERNDVRVAQAGGERDLLSEGPILFPGAPGPSAAPIHACSATHQAMHRASGLSQKCH